MRGTPNSSAVGLSLLESGKLVGALCLILPYFVLYWLVPVFSNLTIGNDYVLFSIEHQMALMFSLEHGSFPLYVPGFAMGQSATALTLGQLYHPLSHLASWIPGYWDGDALVINTQIRLLLLGITHLVLFYTLRKLGLSVVLAFLLSFIGVYNLRMLDMFRYGASIENFTAYIMLCSFIVLSFTRFKARYLLGVALSSYLLTVGGHPQMAYIGFLGAAILTLMTPHVVTQIQPGFEAQKQKLWVYWGLIFFATLVGVLLAAPYALGFYFEFLSHNAIRTNNTYEWAIGYQDSWGGLFRSFYAPLSSNVHGAFGGSSLILLALLFPLGMLVLKQRAVFMWSLFGVAIVMFLVAAGDASPVHRLVWEYLPMASNFRVPGRFALMLIFPLLLILVWLLSREELGSKAAPVTPVLASNLAFICFVGAVLLLALNISFDHMLPEATWPTPDDINDVRKGDVSRGMYLGLASLLAAGAFFELRGRGIELGAKVVGLCLAVFVLLEVSNAMRFGTWMVENRQYKTKDEFTAHIQKEYFVPALPGNGMSMSLMDEHIDKSMYEPKLARFYTQVTAFDNEAALEAYLITERRPDEALVLASSEKTIRPSESAGTQPTPSRVELTEYRYNQFNYNVMASGAGLFTTNLPFRENWTAFVNNEPVDIVIANGYEVAVFLSEGTHEVVLQYHSPHVKAGLMVSCTVAILILLLLIWRSQNNTYRIALGLTLLVPVGLYLWWSGSLYGGDDMGIKYTWSSADFPEQDNISYGKRTYASGVYGTESFYYYYPGLAVNGDLEGAGFVSAKSRNPHWKLDLGSLHRVDSIKLHKVFPSSLPARVWVSSDNQNFKPIRRIMRNEHSSEILIKPEQGLEARYIIVSSERTGLLGFHELEVFGQGLKTK